MGNVNVNLLGDADDLTLVDCGPCTDAAWEARCRGIQGAGCRVEQVRRVLLSHVHLDHAGLAGRVQRVSGCRGLTHPVGLPRLRDEPGNCSEETPPRGRSWR